jgi:replicative DNA helicase
VVIFLYREEYYLERSNKKGGPEHIAAMGLVEVDVAKQRHGPIGTIPMRFNGAYMKFSNMGTPMRDPSEVRRQAWKTRRERYGHAGQ